MSPSAATLAAARPKCNRTPPAGAQAATGDARPVCGLPLRWDHVHATWECPTHGKVITGGELTRRQAKVAA